MRDDPRTDAPQKEPGEPTEATPAKRGGFRETVKKLAKEAVLRRTSTKR